MAFPTMTRSADNVPASGIWTPNGTVFPVLEGSLSTFTDGSGNLTTPATFHHAARTLAALVSAAYTTNTTLGPYTVGPFAELAVDFNVTVKSGTSPTLQFFIDRIGADNVAYNIWSSASITTVTTQVSASIGSGFSTNQSFGATIQLRIVVGGTTPSWTLSGSIIGK